MKILIVSQYYYPEQFQINEIAPELVKMGHEVTVLCGVPNYPKGEIMQGYRNSQEIQQSEGEYYDATGVKVIHVPQVPRGNSLMKLLLNYWTFMRNGKKVVESLPKDYDVVLGYQLSPITSMAPAVKYKKLYGAPLVFYTLDIWPVSAESMLRWKKNPLYKWVAKLSKQIYSCADRIIVTSRPFIDYLKKENEISERLMTYIPQHASADMLELDLSAEDNVVADFVFAGNLGKGQCLDIIVEAARKLGARKDYKVHFVGDGRMRAKLMSMVRDYGLDDNFVFHGNQSRKAMPSFYRMADALLITLRGNNEVGDTLPGKFQMYMTTGKPILGAINGAANEIIKDVNCGACVAAGDSEGLAELMLDFIENPVKYAQMGKNAREYFRQHFTLDIFMKKLTKELESIKRKS